MSNGCSKVVEVLRDGCETEIGQQERKIILCLQSSNNEQHDLKVTFATDER